MVYFGIGELHLLLSLSSFYSPLSILIDTVQTLDIFISLFIGLATIAGSVFAVAVFLKRSVNKTNTDFISNTKDYLNEFKKQIYEKIDNVQQTSSRELDTKLQSVTNIIVEKSNSQKEDTNEIKTAVTHIDNKLNQTSQENAVHRTILQEHDRRLINIESNINKYYNSPVYSLGNNDDEDKDNNSHGKSKTSVSAIKKKIRKKANPYANNAPYDSNEIKTEEKN